MGKLRAEGQAAFVRSKGGVRRGQADGRVLSGGVVDYGLSNGLARWLVGIGRSLLAFRPEQIL